MEMLFMGCGIMAILLAFALLAFDKKKHYGLQEANIKK